MIFPLRLKTTWVLPVLLLMGCGTGQYNDRMEARLQTLKHEAPFAALQPPAEIPGTSVKLAIPRILTRFITPETDDPTGLRGKISAERVKFFPFEAKGVYVGYDAEVERPEGGAKIPVVCQIAVLPKSDLNVLEVLQKKFRDQPLQAETVQLDAFQGDKKLEWSKVHIETQANFDVLPNDVSAPMEFKSLPSVIEVWWHVGEHYLTILTWRAPTEINDVIKLMEMAPLTAATISEGPPPAPAEAPAAEPAEAPAA